MSSISYHFLALLKPAIHQNPENFRKKIYAVIRGRVASVQNRTHGGSTWMKVQRLVVAEVGKAAVPLGDVSGAVAEDLAPHLRGRQAGLDCFLLPVHQHHRIPAGAICGRLTGLVGA